MKADPAKIAEITPTVPVSDADRIANLLAV
jgi:hypothetical protein